MKKGISLLLLLALFLSVLTAWPVQAEDHNLISAEDAEFESGKHHWTVLTEGKLSVVENPAGDGHVLRYGDPTDKHSWSSPQLDVRPYLQAALTSAGTIYCAFDVYSEETATLVVRFRTDKPEEYSLCEKDDKTYCTLGRCAVIGGEWTHAMLEIPVTEDDLAVTTGHWNFCFDNIWNYCEEAFYIDNVYFGLEKREQDMVENQPIPGKTPVKRQAQTLVGTARWDAFEKSTPDGKNPPSEVARVLSPAKYHGQAPFFADIEADGTVSFPEYTLATWEAEARYAHDAGIDYFAYLWYDTADIMSTPRKLHLQSPNKDLVKFCGMLGSIREPRSMQDLWDAMQDSCYLRLDGRPVLFLYGLDEWKDADVAQLRQDAANNGVTGALYIVGMSTTTDPGLFNKNQRKGIDAVSWYSLNATQKDEPFAKLVEDCEKTVKNVGNLCKATGLDLIPSFTAGRDSRARIETGVSWVSGDPHASTDAQKPYGNKYSLAPTMEELQKHIETVLTYACVETATCKTNLVCSYAWNEHEEGGWLCPTLAVDENGRQLFNADGTKKINTERLDALKAAIEAVKAAHPAATTPAAQTASPEVSQPTAEAKNTGCGGLLLPLPVWLLPAALCLKKRKK